ncbi:M16 family metallopeptidase [Thalassotalea maritima]|uniref:M16 family metallopeptidase n=1 Tax=Thalassotalea maritima TaxID=3242416 RepID=UPI0035291A67
MHHHFFAIRLWLLCAILSVIGFNAKASELDIPYTRYVLDNGLTLIVHTDNKAPVVAVNVWYHVGSKNEPTGKTGFAHLFEHLMFNGSENYNDEYFKPFDNVGATGMNGTTNFDRTNYFQVVPKNAVDMALWMESDRMGHLLGAVDQAKLDEQRGVVQNEKRQSENQPYGKAFITIFENMFPNGHPYAHSVIGSMEDLNAASLDDVHQWFKTYYGAGNATIVLAGDIEPEYAKQRVEHYFGHIPSGPPLTKHDDWIASIDGDVRTVMQDRVPQARLYKLWKMPGIGSLEANQLDLISGILSQGKSSRLYKRLVIDEQLASDVQAFAFPLEISGIFGVIATAMPGKSLSDMENAINQEVSRLLEKGPTKDEVKRIVTARKAAFIRGNERVGGFGGKSDTLARNQVYLNQPDFYKTTLQRWQKANQVDLLNTARSWINKGQYVLEIHPFDEGKAAANTVDRSKLPEPEESPNVAFDSFEKRSLDNGLNIVLAKRSTVPMVNMQLVFDAGYAADHGKLAGTASLTLEMLEEGTRSRDALEISDSLQTLGANYSVSSTLDTSNISMSALTENLDDSLSLFADMVINPTFPEDNFKRRQNLRLARIQQEKVQPVGMALRVFPKLIYGDEHPYGTPQTGSGSEASVKAMSPKTLNDFHATWLRPNNATLVAVGDISMDELESKVRKAFAKWQAKDVPKKDIATVSLPGAEKVYLIDRPGSEQSIIFAGHVVAPKNNDNEVAMQGFNEVLGSGFNSRLNLNLREDKHWSYGARTLLLPASGQRPFIAYAPVQTDKTSESMSEIQKEFTDIQGARPPSDEEVTRAKDKRVLTLPGRWETYDAVLGSLVEMVQFGYPDNYWQQYPQSVRALSKAQIAQAAKDTLHEDKITWVVVGDRSKIEDKIKSLGYQDITYLDADGNAVE